MLIGEDIGEAAYIAADCSHDGPTPVEPDTQKDSVIFFESFVSLIMRIIEIIKSVFEFTMFTK